MIKKIFVILSNLVLLLIALAISTVIECYIITNITEISIDFETLESYLILINLIILILLAFISKKKGKSFKRSFTHKTLYLFIIMILLILPLVWIHLLTSQTIKMGYYSSTQATLTDVTYELEYNYSTEYSYIDYTGKYIFDLSGDIQYIDHQTLFFYPPENVTVYYHPETLDDFFVGDYSINILIIAIASIWLLSIFIATYRLAKRKQKINRSEIIKNEKLSKLIINFLKSKLKEDITILHDYTLDKTNTTRKTTLTLDLPSLETAYTQKGIEIITQELKNNYNYINRIKTYIKNNDCNKIKVNFYLSEKKGNIFTFLEIFFTQAD